MNTYCKESIIDALYKIQEEYRVLLLMHDIKKLSCREICNCLNYETPVLNRKIALARQELLRQLKTEKLPGCTGK